MKPLEKIPAVIYARFSPSGQREESITGQLRDCTAWADRNGFRVLRSYEDRARTGTNDRRPGFQQMIRDAEKKKFAAVIVWKMDRFSRSRYDAAIYKAKLKKSGVRVYSAMEPISDGPESIIIEGLLESMAEFYSENLSQNVRRGNYDSALEHKTLGLRLLGLRPGPDDRFEIDPDTAPIVRRIFEEYAAGRPIREICAGLNADGFRTLQGRPFGKSSLAHILNQERYTGTYIYKDLIRDEGAFPAIISRDLFEKVQIIQKQKKKAPAASRGVRYLLTGKLFCGECGAMLSGESAKSKTGTVYYYYTCNGRKQKACDLPRVSKEKMEDFVVSVLTEKIMDDAFVSSLADLAIEDQERRARDDSELLALQAQLADTESRLRNLRASLEVGGDRSRFILDRVVELEDQRDDLLASVRLAEAEAHGLSREEIIFALERLRGDPSDPGFRDRLVDVFLNAVYVYKNNRVIIAINFLDESGDPVSFDLVSPGSSLSNLAGRLFQITKTTAAFWLEFLLR